MDTNLLLVFCFLFFVMGAGGTFFWSIRKNKVSQQPPLPLDVIDGGASQDAVLSPWRKEKCNTLSGTCGKGTMTMTRHCVREGLGQGSKCREAEMTHEADCYVQCSRPSNVVDWGHPNDLPGLPVGSPMKGWYDVSGQGQPNDYCRWVGDVGNIFWACHSGTESYVKSDPSHITFSTGPANRAIPYHVFLVEKMCPGSTAYLTAQDPDLQKSIANGLMARCGARCVYDHRNPKNGWWFDGAKWQRIENMVVHPCGTLFKGEMNTAIRKYENIYDVKNAWR